MDTIDCRKDIPAASGLSRVIQFTPHERDNELWTTSLDVARVFEKRHDNVLDAIEKLECSQDFRVLNFKDSSYQSEQNRTMPMIELTQDGFAFLAMGSKFRFHHLPDGVADRLMQRAKNQGHGGDFREWLREQDLKEKTRTKVVDWVGGTETPVVEPPKEPYPIDKEKAPSPKEESHADTTSARQPTTSDQDLVGDLPTEGLQPNEESGDTGSVREGNRRPDVGGVSGNEQRDRQPGGRENPGNTRGIDSVPDSDTGSVGEDLQPVPTGTGKRTRPVKKSQDYSVPIGGLNREGTWPETARRNVEIIELALKIESENRSATPEEQELLSKYVGFGAGEIRNKLFPAGYTRRGERPQPLSQIWPNNYIYEKSWQELAERLSKLPEQWQKTILQSTQYAHYTSENVTRQMWEAAVDA